MEDLDLLETLIRTLRQITSQHPEHITARELLLSHQGLERLGSVLLSVERLDVVQKTIACLQPLVATFSRTHIPLRNLGVFQNLVGRFSHYCSEWRMVRRKKQFFSAVCFSCCNIFRIKVGFDPNLRKDNIRISDVLACVIGTLSTFLDESSMYDLTHSPALVKDVVDVSFPKISLEVK